MVKNSTAMEKEIISMVWRDFGVTWNEKLVLDEGIRREKLPLYIGEYVWGYNHRNENDNLKVKHIIKLLEHEVSSLVERDT